MPKETVRNAFLARFQEILDAFDELETDEIMEELNAQFEDALFLMECAGDDDDDFDGALEEIGDLLEQYAELCADHPELCPKVAEMEMALQMALKNAS